MALSFWPVTLNEWIESVSGVVTVGAIVIGGWWSYSRFFRGRLAKPKAKTSHEVVCKQLDQGTKLVRVSIRIENSGNVLVRIKRIGVRLQQVRDCDEQTLTEIKNELEVPTPPPEVDWPLLEEREIPDQRCEIEPGECDTVHVDFLLSSGSKTILVYSYAENVKKIRMGWDCTTIHDV